MNDKRVSWPVVMMSALVGSGAALGTVVLFAALERPLTDGSVVVHERSAPPRRMQLSSNEETQQVIAWRQSQMRRFNEEQVAPIWARQTQNQLEERLQVLKDRRAQQELDVFEIRNVECRSSMCVALLRWEDIEHAREASASLAGFNYRLPCATSSLVYDALDKPQDVPYRHEVIFRCQRSRAGG